MTLVLAKERTEEGIKDALFNQRTMVYFYDNLMGKKDYLDKFFWGAVQVSPVYYSSEKRNYLEIKNNSDVPFRLKKVDKARKGYPERIEIPARQSVTVVLSKDDNNTGKIQYEVENLIVSPREKLQVALF